MRLNIEFGSFLLLCLFINVTYECSSGRYPFEKYLGTRTPYRVISNGSYDKIEYEGCKPTKIWMLVRHGTRNPSSGHIKLIKERLPEIRDLILEHVKTSNELIRSRDLDQFRKWKSKLETKSEKKLVHEGEEEMLLLAERMQSKFPDIFDTIYSNSSYKFKYTYSQRTRKSALNFAKGLFGRDTAKQVWFPEPSRKDPILRFYKNCDKWIKEIKKNPVTSKEALEFDKTDVMKKTIKEINSRLGVKDELDIDDIKAMYFTCAFETAWNKLSKSPWCSLFTIDNLKVLEYADDLKFYWQDGYGYELTYQQACPAFGDMINFLESKTPLPKSTVYFTHSGTILKVLAHIGLYKDEDRLTSANYEKLKDTRKFRTSLIDVFGSNLAFASFDCDGKQKLLTLHQENIVRLPSCPDTDLCDIEAVNQFYTKSIKSCNFDVMCNNSNED